MSARKIGRLFVQDSVGQALPDVHTSTGLRSWLVMGYRTITTSATTQFSSPADNYWLEKQWLSNGNSRSRQDAFRNQSNLSKFDIWDETTMIQKRRSGVFKASAVMNKRLKEEKYLIDLYSRKVTVQDIQLRWYLRLQLLCGSFKRRLWAYEKRYSTIGKRLL